MNEHLEPIKRYTEASPVDGPAETPAEPAEREPSFEERVEEQAMRESLAYFEERAAKTSQLLESKKEQIVALLRRVNDDTEISMDELRTTLQLEGEEEGTVGAIAQALEECKPYSDLDSGFDLVVKKVAETLSPNAQMRVARAAFAEGNSWYHTNEQGQARLAQIAAEVRSQKVE